MPHWTKRYDTNSHRVFDGDKLVAIAIRYGGAGGTWRAHDLDDKKLTQYGAHATPKALAKAMDVASAKVSDDAQHMHDTVADY